GGAMPLWSRSGNELFYVTSTPGAPIAALMRVEIPRSAAFTPGMPQKLFDWPYYRAGTGTNLGRTYDISPDGRRFLVIKRDTPPNQAAQPNLVVVQNWFEELKKLVPAR